LVYLRTNAAAAILRDGFHEGHEGYYVTERSRGVRGVCVTAPCPELDADGRGVLEIAVPDELFDKYEYEEELYDDVGWMRTAVIPASELASYPIRLINERAVDTIIDQWFHGD
jgi:hypothetical protein